MAKGAFLITIDTEGDNLWSNPRTITTRNARTLPRFQALCEQYGFKPTYLVNYEMACDEKLTDFLKEKFDAGLCEVGMHLHAWNTPPVRHLTENDYDHVTFLIEYPDDLMEAKVATMTRLLREKFGDRVVAHRSGRWALDSRYWSLLTKYGYKVDCSVTPHISWKEYMGVPDGKGGSDYSDFRELPYFPDPQNLKEEGKSSILEVPVTCIPNSRSNGFWNFIRRKNCFNSRVVRRLMKNQPTEFIWLRPNGRNLDNMRRIIDETAAQGRECVEFMLHSSEMMAGGSPNFPTEASIEKLYEDMDALFCHAKQFYEGCTMTEFYEKTVQKKR